MYLISFVKLSILRLQIKVYVFALNDLSGLVPYLFFIQKLNYCHTKMLIKYKNNFIKEHQSVKEWILWDHMTAF